MMKWLGPLLLVLIIGGSWAFAIRRWMRYDEHPVFGNLSTGGSVAFTVTLLFFYLPVRMWGLKNSLEFWWVGVLILIGVWLLENWAVRRWKRQHGDPYTELNERDFD